MTRNPNWSRDELILALDLYFREGRKQLPPNHPRVQELSKILNKLSIHEGEARDSDFRNMHSVSMKLGNFLSIDPEHTGEGLKQGSKLDRDVWSEFWDQPHRLARIAETIKLAIQSVKEEKAQYIPTKYEYEEEFPEGKVLTRLHKQKERNRKATEEKKKRVLSERQKLECEACGFDFAKVYGNLGYGFAECHHTIPIAKLEPHHKTKLEDLAIICSNCHRMVHRSNPMLSIAHLRALIQEHKD